MIAEIFGVETLRCETEIKAVARKFQFSKENCLRELEVINGYRRCIPLKVVRKEERQIVAPLSPSIIYLCKIHLKMKSVLILRYLVFAHGEAGQQSHRRSDETQSQ